MLGKLHVNSRRPKGPFFPTRSLSIVILQYKRTQAKKDTERGRGGETDKLSPHTHTHTESERVRGPSAIMMRTAIPQMSNTQKIN